MTTEAPKVNLKYFDVDEFKCSHSGLNYMDEDFLKRLDRLRAMCGFSFVITSGYRSPEHPAEASKSQPGTHSQGIAADIAVASGDQRFQIVSNAIDMGFKGIGVAKSFIHVDDREGPAVIWTYG